MSLIGRNGDWMKSWEEKQYVSSILVWEFTGTGEFTGVI